MNIPNRIEYLSPLLGCEDQKESMKFRLIYDGPLQPSQKDPENGQEEPLAQHKHNIRRCFHGQMKRLWETNRFLSNCKKWPSDFDVEIPAHDNAARWGPPENELVPLKNILSELYKHNNYKFVPLVRSDWSLLCDLDILFLRRDIPGSVVHAGDIDNRIKTLIDALRMPGINGAELRGNETPQDGEEPFFVLLEDDKMVSSLSVESDTLLDPDESHPADNRRVRLVVTVTIKPYYVTLFNLSFA